MGHESKIIEHENLVPIWKTGKVSWGYLPGTFIIIISKSVNSQYVYKYMWLTIHIYIYEYKYKYKYIYIFGKCKTL